MRYASLSRCSRACLVAAGLATALASSAATTVQAAPRSAVLPIGSVLPVRLDQSLSSKTALTGDRFTTTVRQGTGDAAMPEGTRVEGVIREAVACANGKPGVLDLSFVRMVTPGGQVRTLAGSLIALDSKSVKTDESGRMVATTSKSKDRLMFIGIGAGAGMLAAVLAKGNKVTYTVLGAAAGYLYNQFGNKPKAHDVDLKPGTEFGVRLDRELAFQTNQPRLLTLQPDTYQTAEQVNQHANIPYDYSYNSPTVSQPGTSSGDVGVMVNDQMVNFDSARPFMGNGVVFVPLEPVARAANFSYSYDTNQKMIQVSNGALRAWVGSRVAVLDGARRPLNGAPDVRDGALYVPAQFIGLATGGSITWDSSSRTVLLTGVAGPSNASLGF